MALTLHGTVSDNTVALDRKTATPLIINGDMQISQRGTSFSPSSNVDFYSIDRFAYFATSGATGDATITQATDAPSNTGLVKSLKITPDATETPTGTHNVCFAYSLEGQDVQVLQHGSTSPESVTLAFWVKSNKTGTYCVQIKEENITDESYVLFEYTINSSNTWEKKVISWTGNSAHTINNDNAQGYRILWHLATGSDDHASATTSWTVSTSFKATSNQVNFFDSTSNELYITGVQLEVGTFDANSIPPFQFEDVGTSLARCMRYYERSQGTGSNREYFSIGIKRDGYTNSDHTVSGIITYKVRKRAIPTIGYNSATSFVYTYGISSVQNFSSVNIQNIGLDHARFHGELGTAVTNSGGIIARREETAYYYDIDSEL
jgi:hypothetical protein